MLRVLRKYRSLPALERRLLLEAICLLGVMRAAILLFPFRWISRCLHLAQGDGNSEMNAEQQAYASNIGFVIALAAVHTPWLSTCLTQTLAGMTMLRRRALTGTLYLGVARDKSTGNETLTAHSWLICGGEVLIGATGNMQFTPIARFTWSARTAMVTHRNK